MYHTYQITQILDVSPHLYMEASMCPGPCGNGSSVTINSKVDQSTDVVRWVYNSTSSKTSRVQTKIWLQVLRRRQKFLVN